MGTLVRTKNLFIAISLVKLNHSHKKYSRKKFYRRIFLKCPPPSQAYFNIGSVHISKDLEKFWKFVTIHMAHGLFSSLSHTYSTLTHISHAYDSSLPHLLHSDSHLSHLWLIAPTLTPLWLTYPYCTFTIYMASYPPVTLAWSYSNIPEF